MSVRVMTWVWQNGPTEPTERLVLLALADHANDQGECFPSMAGIAEKASVTERGARGIIRRLEAAGWVSTKVGGGRGGKSRYTVLMVENPEPSFRVNDAKTRNEKPGISNPEYQTRNVTTENPERDDTKPGTSVPPNHHRTIKEPSISGEPAKNRGSRLSKDWMLPLDWGEWALSEGWPDAVIRLEAAKFKDYWVSKTGRDASKLDWEATWRNWMRNCKSPKAQNGGGYVGTSKGTDRLRAFIGGAD